MSSSTDGSGDSPADFSNDKCHNNLCKATEKVGFQEKAQDSSSLEKKKIMSSKFSDPKLDPAWLFTTLQREINKEATYNLENDAKLRAVSQGTVNYEQFRQMVLGANLRPLDKKDKIEGCQNGKRPYVVWNTVGAAGTKQSDTEEKSSQEGESNDGLEERK